MEINNATTQVTAQPNVSNDSVAAMAMADFDNFLNLFISQIKFQDPLSPLDGTEFLSQTAQFTTVEQLIQLNEGMEESKNRMDSVSQASTASLLGKEVAALINLDEALLEVTGKVVEVGFDGNGGVLLTLEDGETVAMSDVVSISENNSV